MIDPIAQVRELVSGFSLPKVADDQLDLSPGALLPGTDATRIQLEEDRRAELGQTLWEIYQSYEQSMVQKKRRWREIQRSYDMIPDAERSGHTPDASRLVSELTRSFTNIAASAILEGVMGLGQLMQVKVADDQASDDVTQALVEEAAAIEEFAEGYPEIERDVWMPTAMQRLCLLGDAILRCRWEIEQRKTYRKVGNKLKIQTKDHGRLYVDLVDNENVFAWPLYEPRVEKLMVMGHRTYMVPSVFKGWARKAKISQTNIDEIVSTCGGKVDEARDERLKQKDVESHNPFKGEVEICELWCRMPLPGDSEDSDFSVLFWPQGMRALRVDYNTLRIRKPPYVKLQYWREDGSFWGSGVGHELLFAQAADSALWNLKIDNMKITSNHVRVVKAGTMAESMADTIAPGRVMVTEDPGEDFTLVPLGAPLTEVDSAIDANNFRAMRATSITSPTQGFGDPTLKSGASPSSISQLIAQAGKKFGTVDRFVRIGLSNLYGMILTHVQQFAPEGLFYERVGEDNARILAKVKFKPPDRDIAETFRFQAMAPSASSNREVLKQELMVLYRLSLDHVGFLQGLGQQTVGMTNPAGFQRMLEEALHFSNELYRQTIQHHDLPGVAGQVPQIPEVTPPDQIINQLQEQLMQMQQQLEQAFMQLEQAGIPPAPPPDQGMGGPPPGAPPMGGPPVA